MKKLIAVLLLGFGLTGCATQSFKVNGDTENQPSHEQMQNFFVSGLGQKQEVDAADICGGAENVVKVESHHSFLNGLLGVITYGIYTPRDARV